MKVRFRWKLTSSGETGDRVSRRISCELAALRVWDGGKPRGARKDGLTGCSPIQKHEQHRWQHGGKTTSFLLQGEMCLTVSLECLEIVSVRFYSLLFILFFFQMNLVESLLLMRTSSSRSLALTCLYSLYSTANGERSSFCTFLWEQDVGERQQALGKWEGSAVENHSFFCYIMSTNASFSFTFHFV